MAPSVLLPAVDALRPPPLARSRRGRRPQPKASWPSAAVEAAYRKRLVKLVDEMARSVVYWVTAARRKREPSVILAMDADFELTDKQGYVYHGTSKGNVEGIRNKGLVPLPHNYFNSTEAGAHRYAVGEHHVLRVKAKHIPDLEYAGHSINWSIPGGSPGGVNSKTPSHIPPHHIEIKTPKGWANLKSGEVSSDAMAMDDYSSTILARALQRLRRLWSRRFDDMARRLAAYFAQDVSKRTDEQLKKILRDAGLAVKFEMTKAQRDVLGAIVHENVSLIKSIPRKYLDQVEGQVMRSVTTGRDLKQLTDELHETHYASRKYAAFVARDQNNKATGAIQRVRFLENNIEECIWMHSGAGKHPRPTHVKAGRDKVRFKVSEGWWDPHEQQYIWPGYLINCRCSCRPVVRGFE